MTVKVQVMVAGLFKQSREFMVAERNDDALAPSVTELLTLRCSEYEGKERVPETACSLINARMRKVSPAAGM